MPFLKLNFISEDLFLGYIYEKFIEFIDLYTKLGAVVNKYNNRKLVLLDEEEKEKYIQEINCIIPQLPPHNGTIYRGAVRIK